MELKFVKNKEHYYEFIRILRLDTRVISGFVNQSDITKEQQKDYMDKYKKCYYICLAGDVPVGYVGVIQDDIRIATLPEYQRKGVGSFMIKELIKRHPNAFARIKVENEISSSFFKKLSFNTSFYIMTPQKV